MLDVLIPNSQSVLGEQWESMAENMIAGYSALPLIGTPEQVVEGLVGLSEAGYDGLSISWVDYEEGLEQYAEQILPLAIDSGIRSKPVNSPADTAPSTGSPTRLPSRSDQV